MSFTDICLYLCTPCTLVILANNFNDGTTIATVADMSDMIFRGNVDESEVGRIHAGMPIVLSIGALQDMTFDARLEYVSPKGTEENGAVTFEIKAAARIPDSVIIRSGYSANAEIILSQRNNVLTVPEGCVEMVADSAFVYSLDSAASKGGKQVFSRIPVTDIIESVGYDNTSYFYRKFRERYGMSPKEYRGNLYKMPEKDL